MATLDQIIIRLRAMTPRVRLALTRQITQEAHDLVAVVKQDYLSGQMLKVVTERLRKSIHDEVVETSSGVVATVGSDVVYARILHDGGVTKAHDIVARNKRFLAFAIGIPFAGQVLIFAKRVHHPGSRFKPHPFLTTPLAEREPGIRERVKTAVEAALEP